MLTRPPGLSDAQVATSLERSWGIRADTIGYEPVGFGSHHWSVEGGGRRLFVTVDDLGTKRRWDDEPLKAPRKRLRVALQTARRLRDHGYGFVIAPLPTLDGEVTVTPAPGFEQAVYDHVVGTYHSWGPFPTDRERMEVLALVAALHQAPEELRGDAGTEDFAIPLRDQLVEAMEQMTDEWSTGPFSGGAHGLLARHEEAVRSALRRFDELAEGLRDRRDRWVVTHGEPHQANTITTANGVVLIDWETLLVAPPERDLWMMAGEDPTVLEEYANRTGVTADPDALAAYRLWWDLAEIAVYVDQFRKPHAATDDTRVAWGGLQESLDPERWRGL